MKLVFLLLAIGLSWAEHQQPERAEEHIRQVIQTLPSGSVFRRNLEKGSRGDGIHRGWMDKMRPFSVKRALVIVDFEWNGRPEKISPNRTLYFGKYDSECAQITDSKLLEEVRASGLEKELQEFAIQKTKKAHWFYIDKKPHAKRGTSRVELLDDEWLPNAPPILKPSEDLHKMSLLNSISLGDESTILAILASWKKSPSELDDALFMASSSTDNSCVINLLLKAGANPNAQNTEKQRPLMYASGAGYIHNVKALIEAGANVDAENASGKTAIFFAQQGRYADVVRLLEQARTSR
jgi:hypothetical protein